MTASSESQGGLRLPAREIPIPTSISSAAQQILAAGGFPAMPYPSLDDPAAWKALAQMADSGLLAALEAGTAPIDVSVTERTIDDVHVYEITPGEAKEDGRGRVFLEFHGGGLFMGGGDCCRVMGTGLAATIGVRTWSVDYRMPPEFPYPAALDDALVAYEHLLSEHLPTDIIVGGGSAGGNIAAALILRARDEGLPLPAAAILVTPEVDLTESGDSFQTNLGIDSVLPQSLMAPNLMYAGGRDLTDPYLSPLFGDFSKGFPPTLIQTGTRDLFLSNAVRMHRALRSAAVPAELHVFEAMPHGGFGNTPEDLEAGAELRRFADAHWT